jgi:hypothetical protein
MDVEEWLEGLGLAQYATAFAENDIDFAILGKLTDADLKELGISSLGHRKRLLAAIAERGVTAPPSARHADGSPAGERRKSPYCLLISVDSPQYREPSIRKRSASW